jgi:hypothetical protein
LRRAPIGQIAMFFSLPMVGVGLSYSAGKAATPAALIVGGSVFACRVSMLWPERDPAPTLGYGIRLGAAGASAATIGFLLDLDHVGWACAAALLVMGPRQRCRGCGAPAASSRSRSVRSWRSP